MRRVSQHTIRRLIGLQSAACSARTATVLGLQQQQQGLHSSSTPEAPASSAQPAYTEDELQHRTASLNFHEGRLQIDTWGAVSNIPKDDPAPHLRQVSDAASTRA